MFVSDNVAKTGRIISTHHTQLVLMTGFALHVAAMPVKSSRNS